MNKIINMYYEEFESFKGVWSLKNPFFVFFIFFLILFIFSLLNIFDVFGLHNRFNFIEKSTGFFALLMEVFTLILFKSLERQRDNLIIKKYENHYKRPLTLVQIKRLWFKDTIDLPFNEYISLAEKIDKYYGLVDKYSKPSLSRNQILEYIFSVDSKNRVLAMFMGVVALFAGLHIANGVNIEYLYDVFKELDFTKSFLLILLISFFILFFVHMTRYLILILFSLMDFFFDNKGNINKLSKRKKGIFISELLKHYELPKKKHRIYFDL